ncbi:receptor-like protein kinase 2 [Actinidia rufa]|uniref:non-specific serine/threonine protein kinase n=1 Tax=Actinidia rufa TaxID=165716 RepID=A0A7J0ER24_9ERIC|nr:receptor-like protein kinase 2 [Actinidia rufa]
MQKQSQIIETRSLFSLIFLLCCCCLVSGKIFPEKLALLEFKESVSDPNGLLSSWRLDGFNHCSWFGVQCGSNSRVFAIRIAGDGRDGGKDSLSPYCSKYALFPFYGFGIRRNCSGRNGKLGGRLSPVIGKLTELRVLSLPFNEIGGEIPSEIWGLSNLEVLDLEGNSILGYFPGEFGGLRKLRVLNLGLNRISGGIPSSLSQCGGLRILNLAGNEVNGTIPKFIGSFSGLKGLYLSSNRLNGPVPDVFGNNCRHLEHVDLSGNFINDEIPRSLGSCSRLRTLLLFSNLFSGAIPHELGRLRRLEVLDVSRNNLRGPIPPELGNCVELSVLVLSNLFDSSNPRGDEPLGAPSSATDEFNYFEGSIPMKQTLLPKLKIIWAPNLRTFSLEKFSGVFEGCKNLQFLNLSSNRLSGKLDEKLLVPCMAIFDVSGNRMSGPIPSFNNAACSHIPSMNSDTPQSHNPFFAYLSFFTYKTSIENSFPFMDVNLVMIHNFAGNKFTGPIPVLPITPERSEKKINYAFLAGDNKLSGPLFGKLSGNCDRLAGMVVNISNNRIYDSFPSDIGLLCRSLIFFDASENDISGSMPQSIGELKSLVLLDLSGNKLNGLIPHGLANLRNLTVLLLNNNTLSGQIPTGLPNLPSLTTFNVSFNNLSGPLSSNSRAINCSSMLGNPLLPSCPLVSFSVPPPNLYAAPPSEINSENGKNGLSSIQIASIIAASLVAVVLLALAVLLCYVRKWMSDSRVQVSELSDTGEITVFNDIGVPLTYESVVQATGNFNANNCIGHGGFGSTYKAEISPGTLLAVKRLTVERCQGVPQFHAETRTLGRIRHPNLITLIGYHASEAEIFLIYNYLPGGNLKKLILERAQRGVGLGILHKIALDIARALAYLHNQCNPRIIHRDVKPSNVLLDNDLNAYLSDFGLSRLLGTSETHATTGVAGTFGYVAPEYALTCRVSEKADVYSYGVMLLELVSDKRALDPSFSVHGDGFNIVSWASMLQQQGQEQDIFATNLWDAGPCDSLMGMLDLAIICTVDSPSTRPTMMQVVQKLRQLCPPSN